jgi:hypothetical protein
MRTGILALLMLNTLAAMPGFAVAKGCLKGAAVGGVVGHVAGHHALIGAAAGCVIEHHREKVKDKELQHEVPAAGTASRGTKPEN